MNRSLDGHRDDLLGEDVERVARKGRRLDRAVVHALDDDRGLEQVAAVLGEDHALARLADLVAGPADALEAPRDRGGALDLDHEVDRAHVDAQLEAAGRDQRGEAAGLELLLDLQPLLARDAAVVRPDELLAGKLVEALGEALRQAAAVDEHDGAAVLPDQLQDPGMDRGPDAGPQLAAEHRAAGLLLRGESLAEAGHVLDRDDDLELERLAGAGVDDGDLAPVAGAAEETGDGLERTLGGAEADALKGGCDPAAGCPGGPSPTLAQALQALQALQAQREVRAPLAAGDRVDLVHDHVLHAAEDLPRLAREQEIEALRRRDEDVRRVPHQVAARVRGRVARPRGDRDARRLIAQPLGLERDPRQRRPEVALHVIGQRLEGADVQDADGPGLRAGGRRARVMHQSVQAPQERGQGLAAPGGRVDQSVVTLRDRRPTLDLGLRRCLERRLEPGPHGGPEGRERIGDGRAATGPRV